MLHAKKGGGRVTCDYSALPPLPPDLRFCKIIVSSLLI